MDSDKVERFLRHRHQEHYIHRCHLLLLIPKTDTHFTILRKVEGRVDVGGWLVLTYRDGLPARRESPIQVLTGSGV